MNRFLADPLPVVGMNMIQGRRADQFAFSVSGQLLVQRTDIDKFALLDDIDSVSGIGDQGIGQLRQVRRRGRFAGCFPCGFGFAGWSSRFS